MQIVLSFALLLYGPQDQRMQTVTRPERMIQILTLSRDRSLPISGNVLRLMPKLELEGSAGWLADIVPDALRRSKRCQFTFMK
jgi:hypothetical protein